MGKPGGGVAGKGESATRDTTRDRNGTAADFFLHTGDRSGCITIVGTGKMRKSGGGVASRGKGSGTEGANSSTGTRGGRVEEVRSMVET